MAYGYFGKFTAQPGRRDELAALLSKAATELDDHVPDCSLYAVSVAGDDDVWVWEVWADKAAHDASLELASTQALIAEARPLIAAIGEGTEVEMLGGAGLSLPLESMW